LVSSSIGPTQTDVRYSRVMQLAAGDLLVARAWRWDADQIAADIEVDRRMKTAEGAEDPPASISVFARAHEGDDPDRTLDELRELIRRHRNARWIAVVSESEIREKGFELVLSEPPPGHHDLVLGRVAAEVDILALEAVFDARERVRL